MVRIHGQRGYGTKIRDADAKLAKLGKEEYLNQYNINGDTIGNIDRAYKGQFGDINLIFKELGPQTIKFSVEHYVVLGQRLSCP